MEEEKERLEKENLNLRTTVQDRYKFGEIIGKSPPMQEMYEFIAHTAATDANVVILGESGTGKELIARTIHQLSERHEYALVPINCGDSLVFFSEKLDDGSISAQSAEN